MPSFINTGMSSHLAGSILENTSKVVQPVQNVWYGRVVDVILDNSHPQYVRMGGSQALYGIFYQPLFQGSPSSYDNIEKESLRFAYCQQNSLYQIPVKSEIVTLTAGFSALGSEDQGGNVNSEKIYWTSIVPVWNHPHLNPYPDTLQFTATKQTSVDLGSEFKENSSIKPLQLSTGDVALEGRHGQSLRFGGTVSKAGSLSNLDSNGKPFTILRNGQAQAAGSVCVEDINRDDASIYLVSDHKVPLLEANRKFAAAKKPPKFAKDYQGKQIVINSDQVVVNARKDDLELAAKQHLGINAESVSIDGENYLGLDASEIYLGSGAQDRRQPVLKGQDVVDLLNDAFGAINNLLQLLANTSGEPSVWVTAAKTAASSTLVSLQSTLARINEIKSKKTFTE